MKLHGHTYQLSASDLVGYLSCRHLTSLERAVAAGALGRPRIWDPLLEVLWERGSRHEKSYVDHLTKQGFEVVQIEGIDVTPEAVAATKAAMEAGVQVIVQGGLAHDGWVGRADVLKRVDKPSTLGDWSYEPIDTKLARETKGGTVLQLCLYSELLGHAQGTMPEFMYVVPPWTEFEPQRFRVTDFAAYYRLVKVGLNAVLANKDEGGSYPDPVAHCDICRWRLTCDQRRRDDDHLCLVAGASKMQVAELNRRGIKTTAALAEMPLPLAWKPERGSAQSYERLREQARLQVASREAGEVKFETLLVEQGFGLSVLPAPSEGDVFLDFEGDPFVGEHGLEYLLGYYFLDDTGSPTYRGHWALNRAEERSAFERFIDFVMERWSVYPDLHIYHFGGYEPGALKRLMGRYATREEELDRVLRGKLLVDLLTVVRQGVRAGIESYSLKKLEPLYGFERNTSLPDANLALTRLQTSLELTDPEGIIAADRETVEAYNRDDCISTSNLREWLERLRSDLIAEGAQIDRPEPGDGSASGNVAEWLALITPLVEQLTADVPADPLERTPEQHGRWLLANMLDWHRREEKAIWWEFFRLRDLPNADFLDEKGGLGGLTLVGTVGGTTKCPVHRYRFPPQDLDLRVDDDLCLPGAGECLGTVEAVSLTEQTIDIKKRGAFADVHPDAVYRHRLVGGLEMAKARVRLAQYVIPNGLEGEGEFQAARDLLLRQVPRIRDGSPIRLDGEKTLEAGKRVAPLVEAGVLPVQGPPGTGKTFTGAHMICELVKKGKTVGIVANSHTVVRNLLNKVIEAADKTGIDVQCIQKPKAKEPDSHRLRITTKNPDVFSALHTMVCQVAGGTAWLWSRPEAFESVDVLFVDEAAQMSLANVIAVAQAAKTVVLLGDPQQLDQPMQGSHPEGTDSSALDHILNGQQTISPHQGLFLEETWRLHPDICSYTSELFYEGKLRAKDGLERQIVTCAGPAGGAGLRFITVEHTGNQNHSPEEAGVIAELVGSILSAGTTWTDGDGRQHALTVDDVLIIAPYNAQVFEIQRRLPNARVGTVDKFQGQEAPIAIYSLTTSSQADAPRGMEFLYSLNRLNVATSRARCVSILVGCPKLFEAECRTPRQMQLANAFCRYLEVVGKQLSPAN